MLTIQGAKLQFLLMFMLVEQNPAVFFLVFVTFNSHCGQINHKYQLENVQKVANESTRVSK